MAEEITKLNPLKEQLAKTIRIRKFQHDIGGFLEYYFDHHDDPTYREWDDFLEKFNRSMIECPLGHGKSWRITFGQPIHRIVYNRNIRILITSKKAERSVEFVERIANELKTNVKLNTDFGDWAFVKKVLGLPAEPEDLQCQGFYDGANWTKAKFTVKRPKIFREPTCVASGVGGQIEGLRLDYIICDDVIDIEDRTSEVEREKHKEWFRSTLLGRLEPTGRVMLVGTPWHQEDLYAYLEELSKNPASGWNFKRYQALPGWTGEVSRPVASLLPWRWNYEQLMQKYYELGDVEFMAKYQCNPRASEGKWFKEAWLKYYDPTEMPDLIDTVMGCDFNNSEQTMADYTAMVVIGMDARMNYYVMDIFRDHLTDSQPQQIIDMWKRWQPSRIAVEKNGWQRQIYKGLQTIDPRCPVIPIQSQGDKKQRILTLQPLFQQGRIYLNKSMQAHPLHANGSQLVQNLLPFVNEYSAFPDGKNDDMLDAMQMAFELLGYGNPQFGGGLGIEVMGGVSQFFGGGATVRV